MNSFNDMAEAVGMPDGKDKEFIRRIILRYEKKHPGLIKQTIDSAKQDQFENSTVFRNVKEFGEVDGASHRRHLFELPEELILEIERYYPTMFRNKKHFGWFCKHFKELRLTERY